MYKSLMRTAEISSDNSAKISHKYANVQTVNQSKSPPGFRVVVTSLDGINGWQIQTQLRGENDSKQSDEIQATRHSIQVNSFSRIGAKMSNEMPETLRRFLTSAFKRKIKLTLFEILASEDCYIDLQEMVQKVKLDLLSSQLAGNHQYRLVYQWSLVITVLSFIISNTVSLSVVSSHCYRFSFVSSLVTFSCILIVVFIFCKHDPPRLAQLPAGML